MKRIPKKAEMSLVRLSTYNLRVACDKAPNDWESRLPRILRLLESEQFDVFGTQEGLKRQIDDLVSGTRYAYIGVGRDDFGASGEHCAIFFDPDRLECVKGGTFALSETPDVPGSKSWGTECPRIATWGFFHDKVVGRDFCLYNTHLDHVSESARIHGIQLVLDHAMGNCGGLPLVLTGDFNAHPGSATCRFASSRLKDASKLAPKRHPGPGITWHGYGMDRPGNDVIDYIYLSQGIRVRDYYIDERTFGGQFASDHYAVVADLAFPLPFAAAKAISPIRRPRR